MSIPKQPRKANVNTRTSTITNIFYSSILPFNRFTVDDVNKRLESLEYSKEEIKSEKIKCIYCGSESHTWDHLYSLINGLNVTGYYHDISNMVPSCNTCNSRKGSKDFKKWLSEEPKLNDILDFNKREIAIRRIDESLKLKPVNNIKIYIDEVLQSEIGKQYINDLKIINDLLKKNSVISTQIRELITQKIDKNI